MKKNTATDDGILLGLAISAWRPQGADGTAPIRHLVRALNHPTKTNFQHTFGAGPISDSRGTWSSQDILGFAAKLVGEQAGTPWGADSISVRSFSTSMEFIPDFENRWKGVGRLAGIGVLKSLFYNHACTRCDL